MKKLLTALLLATQIAYAYAQTVVQVEYFLDVDGSFATGTLIDLTPAVDSTYEFSVDLPPNITPGYHKLYIRTKNSDGHWSQTVRHNIEVIPEQPQNDVITGEYFFDTDPGYGMATPYSITPTDTDIVQLFTADVLANVQPGYHKLYSRVKDELGSWSQTWRRNVEVFKNNDTALVVEVDYFFTQDLSFGECYAVAIPVAFADDSFTFNIPPAHLPGSYDTLWLRVRDSDYNWSYTTWLMDTFAVDTCTPTVAVIASDSSICFGSNVLFTTTHQNGGTNPTFQWKINGANTGSNADTFSTNALNNGDVVTVEITSNACTPPLTATSQPVTILVTNVPALPQAIDGEAEICEGSVGTYTITSVAGATIYNWTLPSGWNGSSNTTSVDATAGSASGAITVSAENECGTGPEQSFFVNVVNGVPDMPALVNGPDSICAFSTNPFSVDSVGGAATYTWTLPTGWSGTSNTTTIGANADASGGDILVVANNLCGSSAPQIVSVFVNPLPPNPEIEENGDTLESSAATGNQWFLDGSPIPGATGQTYVPTQNGEYHVVVTDENGCTALSSNSIDWVIDGLAELQAAGLFFYPNPVSGVLNVGSTKAFIESIRITDLLGRDVCVVLLSASAVHINVETLPDGVYMLEIRTADQKAITKFTKH